MTALIELRTDRARAVIAPARGGMLTTWDVDGAPLLYLDEETFRDTSKNVRGGAPVLFPSPGKLAEDRYAIAGPMGEHQSGALKQHGFARNLGFTVVEETPSSLKIALASSDETRRAWPWDFTVELSYALTDDTVRIGHVVTNTSGELPMPMPFGFGFHPYFLCAQAEKATAKIPTKAARAFDNVTKKDVELDGPIDLTAKEVDLHLHGHGSSAAELSVRDRTIRVEGSIEYDHWVIWTLEGKDFVCLEPWTCPGNALNTGAPSLIRLGPGESRALFVAFTVTR